MLVRDYVLYGVGLHHVCKIYHNHGVKSKKIHVQNGL